MIIKIQRIVNKHKIMEKLSLKKREIYSRLKILKRKLMNNRLLVKMLAQIFFIIQKKIINHLIKSSKIIGKREITKNSKVML
jgi:hypothetical protein